MAARRLVQIRSNNVRLCTCGSALEHLCYFPAKYVWSIMEKPQRGHSDEWNVHMSFTCNNHKASLCIFCLFITDLYCQLVFFKIWMILASGGGLQNHMGNIAIIIYYAVSLMRTIANRQRWRDDDKRSKEGFGLVCGWCAWKIEKCTSSQPKITYAWFEWIHSLRSGVSKWSHSFTRWGRLHAPSSPGVKGNIPLYIVLLLLHVTEAVTE